MADWYEFFYLSPSHRYTHAFLIILFSQEFFKSTILISFITLIFACFVFLKKIHDPNSCKPNVVTELSGQNIAK